MHEPTLRRAADLAVGYLEGVRERPVPEQVSIDELRSALRAPLNDAPLPALQVVDELAAAVEPGLDDEPEPALLRLRHRRRRRLRRSPPTG